MVLPGQKEARDLLGSKQVRKVARMKLKRISKNCFKLRSTRKCKFKGSRKEVFRLA